MTSGGLLVYMFLTKLSETDYEGGMRVQCHLVGPVHHAARLAFAREHENWKLHHCHPVLFTDDIAGMCLTTIITPRGMVPSHWLSSYTDHTVLGEEAVNVFT